MTVGNTSGANAAQPGNPAEPSHAGTVNGAATRRNTDVLTIYVPASASRVLRLGEGTAIVGTGVMEYKMMQCSYQEVAPNHLSMVSYACRLMHAAQRLTTGKHSYRKLSFVPRELVPVGTYDGCVLDN